ncbi:MAG: hypothetical protein HC915_16075 [Anaerolineae bacterium]|nr:hypothetical protein [Anaerolineae bacterium]
MLNFMLQTVEGGFYLVHVSLSGNPAGVFQAIYLVREFIQLPVQVVLLALQGLLGGALNCLPLALQGFGLRFQVLGKSIAFIAHALDTHRQAFDICSGFAEGTQQVGHGGFLLQSPKNAE